jgi:hypothetical protein
MGSRSGFETTSSEIRSLHFSVKTVFCQEKYPLSKYEGDALPFA